MKDLTGVSHNRDCVSPHMLSVSPHSAYSGASATLEPIKSYSEMK
jgi:hypothetical protein